LSIGSRRTSSFQKLTEGFGFQIRTAPENLEAWQSEMVDSASSFIRARKHMKRTGIILCFLLALPLSSATRQNNPDLRTLYNSRQWFELRDAMRARPDPALYQAVLADGFNDPARADKLLRAVIKTNPKSEDSAIAWQQLEYIYQRAGQFRQLRALIDEQLAAKPDDSGLKADRATVDSFPWEQSIAQRRYSKISLSTLDGNLFIPVSVNGNPGDYGVDTDMNVSMLSESETERLGLTIHNTARDAREFSGAAGEQLGYQTAVADDFTVGNVHLKNVSFIVVPDGQDPFAELPLGKRGIIGTPVLVAFQTIRWSSDGTFEIAFPPAPKDTAKSNLCFDGLDLITEAEFKQRKLEFVVDTGDNASSLYPLFAKDFADLVSESGTKQSSRVTGVDGSKEVSSVILPEVPLQVGGFRGVLRPAKLLLEQTIGNSQRYYGRVGMAFFRQAHQVSIDFQSMTLVVN
jgi:predicted aspartyl protease